MINRLLCKIFGHKWEDSKYEMAWWERTEDDIWERYQKPTRQCRRCGIIRYEITSKAHNPIIIKMI